MGLMHKLFIESSLNVATAYLRNTLSTNRLSLLLDTTRFLVNSSHETNHQIIFSNIMLKNSFQENGTRNAMMLYQHVKTSCLISC